MDFTWCSDGLLRVHRHAMMLRSQRAAATREIQRPEKSSDQRNPATREIQRPERRRDLVVSRVAFAGLATFRELVVCA